MNLLYTFFLLFVSTYVVAQSKSIQFAKTDVIEDLEYLHESLKDAHYNIYEYVEKEHVDSIYFTVRASIQKDSLSHLETINVLQKLISVVHNGHTEIDFPVASYRAYAANSGTVFPFEIAFEDGKNLIRKNFSNNNAIKIGSEIISINAELVDDILLKIYSQISAERTYLKNAKIELYSFPRCYWQVYGQQDNFEIVVKSTNNSIQQYTIKAIDLIKEYEMKRTDVINSKMQLKLNKSYAYLNPASFSGDEKKYQKFIDSAFAEINKKKRKNLIIDLRNNSGGDNSFSDYLVSYIANKPFQWNSKLSIKSSEFLKKHTRKYSDTTDNYFKEILNHRNGEIYTTHFDDYQPQNVHKRYQNNVYVLVNRQSHSQAAVTAAQIQDYKFGVIVGEETGDYPSLSASQFKYPLPNTGILVKVAKGKIIRVNGSTDLKGVLPDIRIKDHLLDEEDEILNGLLKIILED